MYIASICAHYPKTTIENICCISVPVGISILDFVFVELHSLQYVGTSIQYQNWIGHLQMHEG